MVKIIWHEENCIGCGSCASVCDNWDARDDGKFTPIKTIVDEVGCNQDAKDICPSGAIDIEE